MSSTHKKTAPESKALTIHERAAVALGYNTKTAKDLTTLAASTTHITEITNDDGYKQCHAARMVLRNTRIEITKRGKTAREDAQAFAKAVIGEEQRLIALIEPEENRLDAIQTAHDDKIAAEKQAKIDAELARVAAIDARIIAIREMVGLPINPDPQYVLDTIGEVEAVVVDESFEEFEQQAHDAKGATIAMLRETYDDCVARVALEEQARKDQEELARLRAEAAERKRQDDERAAAERKKLEDEARQAREKRIAEEAEERGRQQAAAAAARQAEAAKQPIVAQQQPADVEAERFIAKADVTPAVVAAAASPPECFRPQFADIVGLVASYYLVDRERVLEWISYLPPKAAQRAA